MHDDVVVVENLYLKLDLNLSKFAYCNEFSIIYVVLIFHLRFIEYAKRPQILLKHT
jgi:hypothetical protein